jgi:hypothetical protein
MMVPATCGLGVDATRATSGHVMLNGREGAMRIVATSILALVGAAGLAIMSGTAVRAQSTATTLLNVYEQASLSNCFNLLVCRVDFSPVQMFGHAHGRSPAWRSGSHNRSQSCESRAALRTAELYSGM